LEFARALGKSIGDTVEVNGNQLVLPPLLGVGRVEYYDLNAAFSIAIIDCFFRKDIQLHQIVIAGSDGYKVLFNASDDPVHINGEKTETLSMGSSMADSIFFTSYTAAATIHIKRGQHLKLIALYFRHGWGVKYLAQNSIPVRVSRLKQFANYEPMQFSTCMDLKSSVFVKEMFLVKAPRRILSRILEGYAYQLMALFFNTLVEEEIGEKRIISQDAMRIILLKEELEQNLYEPILTIEEAAQRCLVSRTKFLRLFNDLFQKSYGAFFVERKIELAKDLLDQGHSVMDAGYKVGYVNVSHFIKAFRVQYGITPGAYQQQGKA
jgi:AraC-like DNA-binding protein